MLAALELAGEGGYRLLAVPEIAERAGVTSAVFYRYFEDEEDCYAAAYRTASELLLAQMALEAGQASGGWRGELRSALTVLARFLAHCPSVARGLMVQVPSADPAAWQARADVRERLIRRIDRARREEDARQSLPRITARFVLDGIESEARRAAQRQDPERFNEALPGLCQFAVVYFYGPEAAAREV